MAEKIASILIVTRTAPAVCEQCGHLAELRPYGTDGQNICYKCARKDIVNVRARMRAVLAQQLEGTTHIVSPDGHVLRCNHFEEDLRSSGDSGRTS